MCFLAERRSLKASVIGLGYLGSCIAAMLADRGVDVVGVGTDPQLVEELNNGHCRFHETGLAEMFFRNTAAGRLSVRPDYTGVVGAILCRNVVWQ
ncbi:2-dehydropantoate 2-reductase N-terminal domain-containing protein [Saccharopolyspora gregorii]|uniref:2-dehydropantoate 2-reductase N-terminal domain-containing protein n=1 Tax=Saccharopolyspora gregorii TaxID=33914 RepID=UPI0021ABDC7E|nr:2-dehydropantoate 2-reductase N-terminal domain-containing protein [Saccharopolyspora gregorii]